MIITWVGTTNILIIQKPIKKKSKKKSFLLEKNLFLSIANINISIIFKRKIWKIDMRIFIVKLILSSEKKNLKPFFGIRTLYRFKVNIYMINKRMMEILIAAVN